jgi:hypothetical protein
VIITGNVVRALHRIQTDPSQAKLLVEEEYLEDLLEIFSVSKASTTSNDFNLEEEFRSQYALIKAAMKTMGNIQTDEDLKILKEAKSFLMFIMKQEEKLASFRAVAEFKEAVLAALDEADPVLRDKVLRNISEKLVS